MNVFFYDEIAEDLILNPKEHPDAKLSDVVEIYHPEDEGTRLLLQITGFNEDLKGGSKLIMDMLFVSDLCVERLYNFAHFQRA